jgi:glycosyltransferase involved in cell wall biosynthesis
MEDRILSSTLNLQISTFNPLSSTVKNMKRNMPLVSVIMPVYNAGEFLVPAIESILNQTYKNFEFIIVDDASTDASWEIIKRYASRFPKRITAIRLAKNLNSGGDRCANEGIKKTRGTYIARMDADDIAVPERLAKQVSFLESRPEIFLVGSSAHVINANGKTVGEKIEPTTPREIKNMFFSVHPLIHPTCMFRRMITPTEPFTYYINYNANNDYYTFYRLLCSGYKFANLPEKLLYYRIHDSNATFKNLKGNFSNTVKIRVEMLRKYHLKASFKDVLLLLMQTAIVAVIPNSLLTQVYIMLRGFHKPLGISGTAARLSSFFTSSPLHILQVKKHTLVIK